MHPSAPTEPASSCRFSDPYQLQVERVRRRPLLLQVRCRNRTGRLSSSNNPTRPCCIQYIYICKVDMRNGVQNGLDSSAFHRRKQRSVRVGQDFVHSALGQVKPDSIVPARHQMAISQPMSATRVRESQPTTFWPPLPLTPLAGPGSSLQVAT
jgi:hypothetical protein